MATSKAKPPILPRKPADPTGGDALERRAMRDFRVRFRKIRRAYIDALERIPREPAVNRRYTYQLDQFLLNSVLNSAGNVVDSILLEGGQDSVWVFESYVQAAYQRGTAQAFANLSHQSPTYRAASQNLREVLLSEPYRRRLSLIAAREFEEMQGLSGKTKADMGRVLTDGIGRGQNPREIARRLTEQAGIGQRRANMIARTEITTALRRARWDESEDAQDRYGIDTRLMHYSALSPTTRISHAVRHGQLYTAEEVREWYSRDGNSVNCKCNQVEIMVDDSGQPLFPAIIERAKETERKIKREGRGPWRDDAG